MLKDRYGKDWASGNRGRMRSRRQDFDLVKIIYIIDRYIADFPQIPRKLAEDYISKARVAAGNVDRYPVNEFWLGTLSGAVGLSADPRVPRRSSGLARCQRRIKIV
jgi:hypothetical protein